MPRMKSEVTRIRKGYRFTEDTLNKIKAVATQRNTNATEAIEFMIDQFFIKQSKQYEILMILIDNLLDKKLDEKLDPIKENTSRTRTAANVIDRNTQMMIEFWNHYFIVSNPSALGTTEKLKTKELIEAEQVVQNRIAHNRQKKLDWESKRQNKKTEHMEEN